MKKVIAIIAVLIIAVLGSTYWFGMQFEKKYNEKIDEFEDSGRINILQNSFERGMFTSESKLVAKLETKGKSVKFSMTSHIVHGPIGLANLIKGKIALSVNQASFVTTTTLSSINEDSEHAEILKIFPPIVIEGAISISGDLLTNIHSKPFKHTFKDEDDADATVEFQGIKGNAASNSDMSMGEGLLTAPMLSIKSEEGTLSLKNFKVGYNFEQIPKGSGITVGMAYIGLEKMEFVSEDNKIFLSNIQWDLSKSIKEGNVEFAHGFTLKSFKLDDQVYGPGSYNLAIRNIDAKAWGKIENMLKESKKKDSAKKPPTQMNPNSIMELLPELLKNSPEIELAELKFKTPEGEMKGWGKIYMDTSDPNALNNIFMMMASIKLDAKFSIPAADLETILEEIEKDKILEESENAGKTPPTDEKLDIMARVAVADQIQDLVDAKEIIAKDDVFYYEVSYADGSLKVNGETKDLPMGGMF